MRISPTSVSMSIGDKGSFNVSLVDDKGSVRDITQLAQWSVDNGVIELKHAGGEIVAVRTGLASVTATYGKLQAHAPIGVKARPVMAPLGRSAQMPRYFVDSKGDPVYLAGSHTWSNLQDNGQNNPPDQFDYAAFLDFLDRHNHNFFRLWRWEQGTWMTEIEGPYWFTPLPYLRTGPGEALDGKPKYDLNRFDDQYFSRLRSRVQLAGDRGIFVAVMLFNGWSLEPKGPGLGNPWRGHPLNMENNINGMNGDLDGDQRGLESHSLTNTEVLSVQEALVRRTYEAVADLDNVMFEISNETRGGSASWQYHMIELVHALAREKDRVALVGMTAERPAPSNDALFRGPADWVSPFRNSNDPLAADFPYVEKVVIHDTDHLCGVCGTVPWVWHAMTRGVNLLLMDYYDTTPLNIGRSSLHMATHDWESVRRNMGYSRVIAGQLELHHVEPLGGLSSSGYCLANTRKEPHQYVVFLPSSESTVSLDLRASKGIHAVTWLATESGRLISGEPVLAGERMTFDAPMDGDRVLFVSGMSESENEDR